MNLKRILCLFLAVVMAFGCHAMHAMAADAPEQDWIFRATGRFHIKVEPGLIGKADTALPLEAGETVTIKASYSPFSASIDIGLIDGDGIFHYIAAENGSFDETIVIEERGNYIFAIRNNSDETVSVSGFVNY